MASQDRAEEGRTSAAAALYRGHVMHQRMKPLGHRFRYSVFSLRLDLDRLAEADRQSRLFSVDRFNLLSFHQADHSDRPGVPLRGYVESLLEGLELEIAARRIVLVAYPRILGWVFNPIALYYVYDKHDRLAAMIYEVRNTFGERHTYVCPLEAGEQSAAGIRQSCDKIFHVSPFMPMAMRYHFRISEPGSQIRWRILETDAEGPMLAATFSGSLLPLTSGSILGSVARIPHLTIKILAGIHWEALKLWVKGARYIPRPAPPGRSSLWRQGRRQDHEACEAAE